VKGVEVNADHVFIGDGVAPGERGADAVGGVFGAEREIESVPVVADQDLRALRRLEMPPRRGR
jgi:hypothetical protein